MLKISSKNTFILKEVAQPYRSDQILHMQLQQEALSTTCLGLPNTSYAITTRGLQHYMFRTTQKNGKGKSFQQKKKNQTY